MQLSIRDILTTMDYGPAPEADTVAREWLRSHDGGFDHFIDNAWVPPADGARFEVSEPASGRLLAEVAQGGDADIAQAVAAARRAFGPWSALSGHARARHLYAIARHLQKRERLFSTLESLDNGKPIRESRDIDVPLAVRHFYHHAGWAELVDTEFPDHRPLGVCGQIIPWNFPLLMLTWKVAPALAAGNTVVLKPAEYTPLTALAFAEICREAGLPPGVLNIVTGDGRTGALLVEAGGVDKIAFTGSTEVGRRIREATAGTGKKLSLELGGKSPFIVFDDSDLDSAVEGVVDSIWFNQGQVCCAGSRILVQEGVAERFHHRLVARMELLRVGDPMDKSTDIGAIVAPVQLQRIRRLVAQGCAEGAVCWQPKTPVPEEGLFYPPTLLTEVEPASTLAQEEIFGPVVTSTTFRTLSEAVELANNSRYGLAASVWSESLNVTMEVAGRLKAGVVWVNCTNQFDAAAGFGGYRESGFGREGGREGMAEYLAPVESVAPSMLPAGKRLSALPDYAAEVSVFAPQTGIDRTAKLYVGGRQARPDSGYSATIHDAAGHAAGQVGLGNRKDIRNAVEAAHKARGWETMTAHARAQVLYYLAENLEARAPAFAERIESLTGVSASLAKEEVAQSIQRIFWYAAQADKYDGAVHATRTQNVTLAMNEPWGVVGVVCPDESPLLALVSLVMPLLAMGNRVVAVPSAAHALIATDLYQVLDTSDLPGGALNIVTGNAEELALVLAQHDDVAALWYVGTAAGSAAVERASAGNLKYTWTNHGIRLDWRDRRRAQGRDYLRRATQIKNIWVPYGE
ncbi:MAG TPA: aldehyde dehydrogenase family protein [Acidisoma sp.]|uniref:aldehyde dehydrogenase family protein n=1 Tax=Acidisoma sp. TaxID=1872115 RepID=UPI002B8EF509|nr:aldehyde dehydrogenase family protein [Acidisoma sp.]HTI03050.1 aldehyde dehydrogenase family protein [Acidisoma sp.]